MGTLLWARISRNNPRQQAYFSKCRSLEGRGGGRRACKVGEEQAGRESRGGLVQERGNYTCHIQAQLHLLRAMFTAASVRVQTHDGGTRWCPFVQHCSLSFSCVNVRQTLNGTESLCRDRQQSVPEASSELTG